MDRVVGGFVRRREVIVEVVIIECGVQGVWRGGKSTSPEKAT